MEKTALVIAFLLLPIFVLTNVCDPFPGSISQLSIGTINAQVELYDASMVLVQPQEATSDALVTNATTSSYHGDFLIRVIDADLSADKIEIEIQTNHSKAFRASHYTRYLYNKGAGVYEGNFGFAIYSYYLVCATFLNDGSPGQTNILLTPYDATYSGNYYQFPVYMDSSDNGYNQGPKICHPPTTNLLQTKDALTLNYTEYSPSGNQTISQSYTFNP